MTPPESRRRVGFTITVAVACAVACPRAGVAKEISVVSVSGQFSDDAGRGFSTNSTLAVDNGLHEFFFKNPASGAQESVDFKAQFIETTNEGNGELSDVVKISYASLFGTGFLANAALLNFDGEKSDGTSLPIDRVVDYSKAGTFTSGWILNTAKFPSNIAAFHTQQGNLVPLTNGAPNGSSFTLNYSYPAPVPEPSSIILLGSGIVLGMARRLKNHISRIA